MTIKLAPEQEEDAVTMAHRQDLPNFSLAGTGKTYTALRAIQLGGMQNGLVLCPKIALTMWGEEIEGFLGAKAQVIRAGATEIDSSADFWVTTYDLLANNLAKFNGFFNDMANTRFDTMAMVNDESHYVRSPDAKRTQAVFGRGLSLDSDAAASLFGQVWNMTGTPMVAYADDYYTQVAALHSDLFASIGVQSLAQFERMFTYKKQKQYSPRMQPVWKIVGNTNEAVLNDMIYRRLGAIRRTSVTGLPELRERDLRIKLTMTREMIAACKGKSPEDILREMQSPNSPISKVWHYVGLAKVDDLLPHVGDSARSGPVLLGIWHRDVASAYEAGLKKMGLKVAQVNGSTSDAAKETIRKQFNSGFVDVLIGQMAAMGVSWNLQKAAAHVIIAEEYPSPSVIEQFYKRVYRRGQQSSVMVEYATSDNPVDEALRGVRIRKARSDEKINKQHEG